MLSTLWGGCLGEDRCGPNQRREGERCVSTVDADILVDGRQSADRLSNCAVTQKPEELVGQFGQEGQVVRGTCTGVLPKEGEPFSADLSLVLDGDTIKATFSYLNNKFDGAAMIEPERWVKVTTQGPFLTLTISVVDMLCFTDKNNALAEATISISDATGPKCDFDVSGTLTRK